MWPGNGQDTQRSARAGMSHVILRRHLWCCVVAGCWLSIQTYCLQALKPKSLALSGINQISISMVTAPLQCTRNIYLPAENWKTKQSWCIHTHTLAWMYAHVYTHACRYTHTMHYEIMDFFEVLREVKGTVILQCYCKIMWNMIRNVFNVGCARLNQS